MDKDKDKDKDAGSWKKDQLSGWNFDQINTVNAEIKDIIKYICTN